jgi:hypothetical protein
MNIEFGETLYATAVEIAKTMVGVEELPTELERRIVRVSYLVAMAGGILVSRQVIAGIILQWELEQADLEELLKTVPRTSAVSWTIVG